MATDSGSDRGEVYAVELESSSPAPAELDEKILAEFAEERVVDGITVDGMRQALTDLGWHRSDTPPIIRGVLGRAESWQQGLGIAIVPTVADRYEPHEYHRMVLQLIQDIARFDAVSEPAISARMREASRADDSSADAR